MVDITVEGAYIDFDKLYKLEEQHWYDAGEGIYVCLLHNVVFQPEEGPCWDCWDSCTVNIEG